MWKEIIPAKYWKLKFDDEPEIRHIIKTGYENLYIVVCEDGYEMQDNSVRYMTAEQIKNSFDLDVISTDETDLDKLNSYLRTVANMNVGVRRKAVELKRFANILLDHTIRDDKINS